MPLGGAHISYQGAPLEWKRSFFSVRRVIMGERSELFWLRAIASLAEVIASLSVSTSASDIILGPFILSGLQENHLRL